MLTKEDRAWIKFHMDLARIEQPVKVFVPEKDDEGDELDPLYAENVSMRAYRKGIAERWAK